MLAHLIARLTAAVNRCFAEQPTERGHVARITPGERSLEYDAYIRANVGPRQPQDASSVSSR